MTEGSPAGTIFRVDRLEYGKFCVDPFGPIAPGAGYGHLAASLSFPPDLVPVCTPFSIGLSETVLGRLEAVQGSHVSVVIPCRGAREIRTIFCVTRVRPEDGEAGKGRGFTLARFCTGVSGINPAVLYRAANYEPFLPLTRSAVQEDLSPAGIPAIHGWNVPDEPDDTLTATADTPVGSLLPALLPYLFSGIPVLIKGAPSEGWFYSLLAVVWRAVPHLLRPLLRAGWGIPPDIAQQFAICASQQESELAAVYDYEAHRWRDPRTIRAFSGDVAVSENFSARVLMPGQLAGNIPTLQKTGPILSFYVKNYLTSLAPLPRFDDHPVWQLFRTPPRIIRDSRRVGALKQWIEDSVPGKAIDLDILNFDYPVYACKALPHLIRAMAIPEKRRPAEEALRVVLLGPHSAAVARDLDDMEPRDQVHTRAQLLRTLVQRNANGILFDYKLAVEVDQAADIPSVYEKDIIAAFEAALANARPEELKQIRALFHFPLTPEFSRWLNTGDNAFLLAMKLLLLGTNENWFSSMFFAHAPSPAIAVLDRWIRRVHPGPNDVQPILQLPEQQQALFASVIESAWNSYPEQTESMLPWAQRFYRKPDVLLDLAERNWAQLPEASLAALLKEISSRRVPSSLNPRVAAILFRHWGALRESNQKVKSAWNEFLALLPLQVQKILSLNLGSSHRSTPPELRLDSTDPAMSLVFVHSTDDRDRTLVHPSPRTIETLLTDWAKMTRYLTPDLAIVLHAWANHAVDSPTGGSRFATVRAILSGVFPLLEPTPAVLQDCIDLLTHLAVGDLAKPLWNASRQLWHIKLVLQVFPGAPFFPGPGHEMLLVGDRKWLAEYLRRKDLADTAIDQFGACCRDFLSTPYPHGDQRGPWLQEFKSRPCVWAAFKALPPALRGKLSTALDGYAASPQERAGLCLRYLEQNFNDPQLLRDVLIAFGFRTDLPTLDRFAVALFANAHLRIDGQVASVKAGLRTVKMERREAEFLEKVVTATTSDTWSKALDLLPVKEDRRGNK